MQYIGSIFKNSKFNISKALKYGFKKQDSDYVLEKPLNDDFKIILRVLKDKIDTKIIENETNDEYSLIYVEGIKGKFVNQIKKDYENFLKEINANCFDFEIFKTKQAKEIISYIDKKYNIKPEYLREKFPNNAVFRNKDNEKRFLAILTANKKAIGLDDVGEIEVIDLKGNPLELEKIIDNKKFFKGYHMNKKYRYTVLLDNNLDIEEIFKLIDKSFEIVKNSK